MKINFLNKLKSGSAIITITILAVSCSKDKAVAPPVREDAAASPKLVINAVPTSNTYTVTGVYAYQGNDLALYGTIYVDLATGAQNTSTFPAADVRFTSNNNSVIQVPSGATLKYLYTNKTFANLKISDFANISAVTSVGRNTSSTFLPNGWFNAGNAPEIQYIQVINNFYILITPAVGNPYLLQITQAYMEGSLQSNTRGVFTIKTGVINNN